MAPQLSIQKVGSVDYHVSYKTISSSIQYEVPPKKFPTLFIFFNVWKTTNAILMIHISQF